MNETAKTIAFVLVSTGLAVAAWMSHQGNRPTNDADFALAGQPFYKDFESSSDAKALDVVTVNPDTMELQRFSVQNIDGTWRIPSHHNYPAEAADRLAQTAASAIGIIRASVAGKAGDFERLGVVDPLEMDSAKLDDASGIGQRFTLRDANGEPLVDLILGKPAGEVAADLDPTSSAGGTRKQYYYVRRPDEKLVYKAVIDLSLSTKFSDWIDPDLLRLDTNKIRRVNVDNYELKEQPGSLLGQVKALIKEQGDQILLSRKSFSDPWELPGINLEQEELNSTRIQSVLEVLSQLTIAGVRPKFKFNNELLLTPDLKFNPNLRMEKDVQRAQQAVDEFMDELEDRGFSLAGTQQSLELASANGQFQVGTEEGVLYTLHIGRTIEGTEKEIEIGGAKSVDDVNTEEEKQKIANYQEGEKNRYMMISVSFDESLLGDKPTQPVAPVEPTKPEGYTPAEPTVENTPPAPEAEQAKEPTDAAQDPAAETKTETESDAAKPDQQDPKPERDPAFVAYDEAMKLYEQQKIEFELNSTRFEEESKAYATRIADGKKLVAELNQRFGDWYYVIRASNLRTLQLKRVDVVQARADLQQTPPPSNPDIPNFGQALPPGVQQPEMKFEPGQTEGAGQAAEPATEKSGNGTDQPQTPSTDIADKADKANPQTTESAEGEPAQGDNQPPAGAEPAPTGGEPKSDEGGSGGSGQPVPAAEQPAGGEQPVPAGEGDDPKPAGGGQS